MSHIISLIERLTALTESGELQWDVKADSGLGAWDDGDEWARFS